MEFSEFEEGFRFGTCGGIVTISTKIDDPGLFVLGMRALIDSRTFTMP